MKRVTVLVALVLAVVACGGAGEERSTFVVTGMHCDGCSSAITEALNGIDGVSSAWADHEKGIAEAVYSPRKVSAEALKTRIEQLGFIVSSVSTVEQGS